MPAERALAVALAVEVDAVRVRQEAQAFHDLRVAVEGTERVCEPAQRSGTDTAHHGALLPGKPDGALAPVGPPRTEQADDAPAANVDEVAREDVLVDVRRSAVAAEERDVRRVTATARQ